MNKAREAKTGFAGFFCFARALNVHNNRRKTVYLTPLSAEGSVA